MSDNLNEEEMREIVRRKRKEQISSIDENKNSEETPSNIKETDKNDDDISVETNESLVGKSINLSANESEIKIETSDNEGEKKEEKVEVSNDEENEDDSGIITETDNVIIESSDDEEESETDEHDRFDINENIDPDNVDIDIESETDDNLSKSNLTGKTDGAPIKIGSKASRSSLKRLSKMNPGQNIKIKDDIEYQKAVIEQYISNEKGGDFTGPRSIQRVVLPYSGIFYDISSYTNSEMLNIHRSTAEMSFLDKLEQELHSAFKHTVNTSLRKDKEKEMTFDVWLRNIKYPDLWCIYWGIYAVNYPGINDYGSRCDFCASSVIEKRDNYEICFVHKESEDDIDQGVIGDIRNRVDKSEIKSYKNISSYIEKEDYLPETKFKVVFGVPNMEDVIIFLRVLKKEFEEDDEIIKYILYPLSHLAIEPGRFSKTTISKILAYKYMMFTRKMYVPVFENIPNSSDKNGKPKIKATYVDVNSLTIPLLIDKLSKDDFKEMIKGKEVKKLMIKEGIQFRIKDSVCPSCKKKQLETVLDMRDIIFMRAAQMMDFLTDT